MVDDRTFRDRSVAHCDLDVALGLDGLPLGLRGDGQDAGMRRFTLTGLGLAMFGPAASVMALLLTS